MKKVFIAGAVTLLFPSLALGAGFAKESIFLSKTSVTEGDTVLVHTIISNDATTGFSGTLTLTEGDKSIGTVPVTLDVQEAHVASVSWKPSAGAHTITAALTDASGNVVEKESAVFNVQAPPSSEATSSTAGVTSSENIQNQLASLSPGAAQVAAPVFTTIDGLRNQAVQAIDSGIEWATSKATKKKSDGMVLGEEGEAEDGSILDTIWTIVATLLLHLLSILRYLVSSAAIFYPVFAVLFLYGLWRLYKRMRRPRF